MAAPEDRLAEVVAADHAGRVARVFQAVEAVHHEIRAAAAARRIAHLPVVVGAGELPVEADQVVPQIVNAFHP